MASAVFVSALGNFVSALFLIISAYVYVSLIRQISARPALPPDSPSRVFGLPEAMVAAFLISFLLLNVIAAVSRPSSNSLLSTRDLVINLILIVAVVLILVGFLKLRGFDLEVLGGFSKIGIIRAIGTGAVLLILSYPLINLAD